MIMPNFLIIGAAKAGTTSIAQYLKQHPQVYISPLKEPYFFALEGETPAFQGPGDRLTFDRAVTNLQDYQQLFNGVAGETAIGEASVLYLYSEKAPHRIHHYLPDVKLIAILRDPVEKAYASFMHQIRDGHEPLRDFSEALEQEAARIQDNWMFLWHYCQNGFYFSHLKRYYDLFDQRQIKVYLYEDLRTDSLGLIKSIFQFLEVDDSFIPDLSVQYNISGVPKNQMIHRLLTTSNPIKTLLKPIVPRSLKQKVRKQNLAKPEIPSPIRQAMIQGFREDILSLQDLIDRDLSAWLI